MYHILLEFQYLGLRSIWRSKLGGLGLINMLILETLCLYTYVDTYTYKIIIQSVYVCLDIYIYTLVNRRICIHMCVCISGFWGSVSKVIFGIPFIFERGRRWGLDKIRVAVVHAPETLLLASLLSIFMMVLYFQLNSLTGISSPVLGRAWAIGACAVQTSALRGRFILGATWMLFGDFVSGLSNWPYGADYGLLFGLLWDTKWTY